MTASASPRSQSPCPPRSVLAPPKPPATSEASRKTNEVFDLIGIGFGPANLALSIALRESQEAQDVGLRCMFVERQPSFAWHSSLLLPGAQLQVSPLKDLATMRDPTSSYTFINYLHQQGRLASFINREANIPSRREWSAYLTWAAKRMDSVVRYSQEVVAVEPVHRPDVDLAALNARVQHLCVTTRNINSGEVTVRLTKNITVGVGGVPRLPPAFHHVYQPYQAGKAAQIAHSGSYLPSLAMLEPMLREREAKRLAALAIQAPSLLPAAQRPAPLQFAVIGGGQSSAEISMHLRKTFPTSHVKLIFRASALVPSDDSAFVNAAAFDPDRTDVFWKANEEDRRAWSAEYRRTNYSVIRSDVLNEIHTSMYDQDIDFDQPWPNADGPSKHGRLDILSSTQVNAVHINDDGCVELGLTSTKNLEADSTQAFDAVFLGTGFERQPSAIKFLQPVQEYFPLLDDKTSQRRAELGFADEVESSEVLADLAESSDEYAVEKLRQRTRGIARDYRLVSYWSDAFAQPSSKSSSPSPSGMSSPSRRPSETSSSNSSSATLAGNSEVSLSGRAFEPSIYFLGGNEMTHGLSDSLLSIVAHRAGELSESLLKSKAAQSGRAPQDIDSPPIAKAVTIQSSDIDLSLRHVAAARSKTSTLSDDIADGLHERVRNVQVA